ncbi:type II toxin-antitoxin system RelE/ParE family toxin [Hymenobacter sp. ISL-91]|uniref:type II toxin-antitoxin system RelE/ParE family toxin n=1 Tax=Hymenobacter sp. ISL-91 TaxID=2819151 RepID=UPI001BE9B9F8|nr:type II toxin-antitoxin system RelE/ParE family toxin [Hymenobacter sp. ISL-91]MBT2557492.1 type II toxin-antitoxin system RelE/ParE family toxin [Hymenobacter sp. ISL-91]
MSFQVKPIASFKRDVKRLGKKYRSLPDDLNAVVQELRDNPYKGTGIGHNCYKIRLAVASKGAGKRGGARVITYVQVVNEAVFLLAIYDKSEQSSLSDQHILGLLGLLDE